MTAHKDNFIRLHNYNDSSYRFESGLTTSSQVVGLENFENHIYTVQEDGAIHHIDFLNDEENNAYLEEAYYNFFEQCIKTCSC